MNLYYNREFKMRLFKITILLFLLFSILLLVEGKGLDQKQVKAFRTEEGIKIDGILNEVVWQLEGFGGFLQSDPNFQRCG